MTVKELHNATAALGFEDALESAEIFYAAANRALYCANRIRPKTEEIYISQNSDTIPDTVINGRGYVLHREAKDKGDFLCYAPRPLLFGVRALCEDEDFIICANKDILVSADISGDLRIVYYACPRKIKNDDEEEEIDLDEDICQILPLLVASYVWLEDETEKAVSYKNLFFAEAREIESFAKRRGSALYASDEGWDK